MGLKINPVTGNLDLIGSSSGSSADNFSYNLIDVGESVTIPAGQQMLYVGDLQILGDLIIEGDLVEINNDPYHSMSVSYIGPSELFLIPVNHVMFFKTLTIDGDLRIEGDLIEV
jgi:hypothetical protein